MRKGHYRYIRKSSFGAYDFGGASSPSPEIKLKNAQHKWELMIANATPETLPRKRAVALIDEMERIYNSDWKNHAKPSTYTRDKICYKINTGVYDELLSKEGIFDDWESLVYKLYKSEEEDSLVQSTETWDKTANMIEEIKKKGNLNNPKEVEFMLKRVDEKVQYYSEKYGREKVFFKLFVAGTVIFMLLYVLVEIISH